jgi:hypothetical protein
MNNNLPLGLGFYPGDKCYDPGRPSWYPYWLQTLSEEVCNENQFWGSWGKYPGVDYTPLPVPPAPPTVGIPSGTVIAGSGATPAEVQAIQDKLIADEKAAYDAQVKAFMAKTAAGIDERTKPCSWYQTKNADTGTCDFGSMVLWIVGIGGVAAAVYLKR